MIKLHLFLGFIGALSLYVGDMLLYGTTAKLPENIDDNTIKVLLKKSSSRRLFFGSILGPFAAIMSAFGAYHIPLMAVDQSRTLAMILFVLFVLSFSFSGAYHMAFILLGDAAHVEDDYIFQKIIQGTFAKIKLLVFGLLGISSIVLATFIVFGGLTIPRYFVIFSPFVLFILMPLLKKIPQPVGIFIWGGWTNLVFVIYYSILLITSH